MADESRQASGEPGSLLSGLTVLDLGHYVAGPYCTKLMAALGAEVVKIERPGHGDGARHVGPFPGDVPDPEASALFLYLNTGKKSVSLNLKSETGRAILKELAAQADILVENFEPRVMPALGLAYEWLEQANPGLVMTSISNFGQTGPYRDFSARELNLYAYGGLMYITGRPEREPLQMGPRLAQYGAGQNAFVATLAAVWHRDISGQGQHIDISIAEYCASILENALSMYSYTGQNVMRTGNRGYGRAAWGIYLCKDGHVGVIAGPEYRWPAMAELMEEPALNDARFSSARGRQLHSDEVETLMETWLRRHGKREIFERAQDMGLAFSYVASPTDILEWEHLRQRDYFVSLEHPKAGRLDYPGPPFQAEGAPWRWERAPMLGEHTREVLCMRLGYAERDLAQLRRAGVV